MTPNIWLKSQGKTVFAPLSNAAWTPATRTLGIPTTTTRYPGTRIKMAHIYILRFWNRRLPSFFKPGTGFPPIDTPFFSTRVIWGRCKILVVGGPGAPGVYIIWYIYIYISYYIYTILYIYIILYIYHIIYINHIIYISYYIYIITYNTNIYIYIYIYI